MQGGMNNELWLSHASEIEPQVDLQDRIWDELRGELPDDIAAVSVWVEDSVATLTGTVPSYEASVAIQQATERVRGLRGVLNQLRVVLPTPDCRLEWDVRVPHVKLSVRVEDGWVTLAGSVERQCQRGAAEEAVRHLTGVQGIRNEIVVEPPQPPPDLQRRVRDALARVGLHGSRVSAETHDRSVTLRGRVHSLAERQVVERAVWGTPGVAAVEDLLTVR
jgi:osmotically-inducible protein OsmY